MSKLVKEKFKSLAQKMMKDREVSKEVVEIKKIEVNN